MKKSYCVIITEDNGDFIVYVPDFDINTQGNSFSDALFMAKDAIEMCALCMKNHGLEIPEPTYNPQYEDNERIGWINIDLD